MIDTMLMTIAYATSRWANPSGRRASLAPLLLTITLLAPFAASAASDRSEPIEVLVVNFELVGDLGGASFAEAHAVRLDAANGQLRETLGKLSRYRVIDDPTVFERMAEIGKRSYLHACNGCERTLARAYGARQVLVPWVYRVSALVLTLHAEFRDVETGSVLSRHALDFRGEDERAWSRAIDYLVREIEERGG